MKRVCLYSLEQPGVVVLSQSGVTYWNKTGDIDPRFQAEGILVPISNDPPNGYPELSLVPRLQDLTANSESLSVSQVSELDSLLQEVSSSDAISVDRARMGESSEGWVYLTIRPQGEFSYFVGFLDELGGADGTLQAVLTWHCSMSIS